MTYIHGASKPLPSRTAAEAHAAEVDARKLATRIKTAMAEQERLRAVLDRHRATIKAARKLVAREQTRAQLAVTIANEEATKIMVQAERECEAIRERAHRQAWALRDRAYTEGFERRLDKQLARTTVLNRH